MRLYILFLILLLTFSTLAQDSEFEQFQSPDGTFTISIPYGWSASGEMDADGTLFAAVTQDLDNLFESGPTDVQPGQQAIIIFGVPRENISDFLPANASPDELAELAVANLLADDDNLIETDSPIVINLENDVTAGQIYFRGGTANGVIVVFEQGEYVIIAAVITHQDEFSEFEPLAMQIIPTFRLNLDVLSHEATLPDIIDVIAEDMPVRNVIVDLDMAHDDMIALLFLLKHPHVNVLAVTVSGTGEAHCEAGVRNALGLLALSNYPEIPVACGRETPLSGIHEFPAEWRRGADEVYGVTLPEVTPTLGLSAVDTIVSIASESRVPVTLIAVGPLTNLGEALQNSPEISANLDEIYIMGGAFDEPGNVGLSGVGIDNFVAEWNIFIDPTAANIVLHSGVPLIFVPLDATKDVPITTAFLGRLDEVKASPEANFVSDILNANVDLIEFGGFQFWDTLTAAVLTDASLAEFETWTISIVEDEGEESGYTHPDENGVAVRVAINANRERFETLLLTVINQSD